MFVRNAWYIAAMADEVGRNVKRRWILDEPVVLYRTADGKPVVGYNVRSCRSMPLSKGELLGDQLHRGYDHLGSAWRRAGHCTLAPGTESWR